MKNGLLGVGLKSTDYSISLLGSNTIPKNEHNFSHNKMTYNQGNTMACTVFACFTLISNKFNIEFDDEFIKERYSEACRLYGASAKNGWYISSAVDYTRRWFNDQPDLVKKHGKLMTGFATLPYSYEKGQSKADKFNLIGELLNKGHDFVGGHNGSRAYNEDFQSDGVLNLKKLKNPSYAHCISMSKDIRGIWDMNDDLLVNNSWKGVKNNVYRLKYIQDLVDNGVLFPTVYCFFSERDEIKFDKMAYNISGELAERFDGQFVQTVPTGTIFYIGNGKALNCDKYFTDFNKRDLLAQDLNKIEKNIGISEEDFMSMV